MYRNVFIADTLVANSIASYDDQSTSASTHNTFTEKDFKLPDLEVAIGMDLNDILLHDRHKKQFKTIKHEIIKEHTTLTRLDRLANTTDDEIALHHKKGVKLGASATRKLRVKLECEAELATMRQIVTRKPGELTDKLKAMQEQIESESANGIDDDMRESSIDHPKLDSVHEKMEDLRQEAVEKWCASRGKDINEKYSNLEKRMLRKWFKELDYDGSGEVNVEELQDPMLSAGILKTREQVVRVLANVDKNGTMGIDFEEFLVALSANKLADKSKLKKLQEMSAHPFFSVDTLITCERRKKLLKSIVKQSQLRQAEIDRLYKKYDKPKLSRKERDLWVHELDELEEKQSRSIFLHLKYLHALDGVIEDKKEFYAMQKADAEKALEASRPVDALDELMTRPGYHLSATDPHDSNHNNFPPPVQHRLASTKAGISESTLGSRHSYLPQSQQSVSESVPSPAKSFNLFEEGKLHNPYSIYAPPTHKYNHRKKIDAILNLQYKK